MEDQIKTDEEKAADEEKAKAERTARLANSPDLWNSLWEKEGHETWRKHALNQVYTRIERTIPSGARVIDFGGGVGALASRLTDTKKAKVLVVDHSVSALEKAMELGLETAVADLEVSSVAPYLTPESIVVATEVAEHLSEEARQRLFSDVAKAGCRAFFSVPNDRLGPDEEPQHTIKYTAMMLKRDLLKHFQHVRIEVFGRDYLLGICGYPKNFKMSMTLPCRDEAEDVEKVLASFMAVADEIVVGIDPRTVDNTREVALKYADVVFDLVDPEGPEGDRVPNGGVHFSWVRNQCIEKCTSEWIFMTEGHERLVSGWETLLSLGNLPKQTQIGFVMRTGNDQQWGFPWLFKKNPNIYFQRQTHNVLEYPAGTYAVQLPNVRTLHERVKDREMARREQRKTQNRLTLLSDWVVNQNEASLHYLGTEWREHDPEKAARYLEEYLSMPRKNGPMRYHTRLILAKHYGRRAEEQKDPDLSKKEWKKAREALIGAVDDDWSRTEHWIWLGDIAYNDERFEEALQFYLYAGTKVGEPPFTLWWVDLSCYSWLPAQRLAMTYGELGRIEPSLHWARKVLELLPDDAEAWAFEEARSNIKLLEEALEAKNPT